MTDLQGLLEEIEFSKATIDEKGMEEMMLLGGALRNVSTLDHFMQFVVRLEQRGREAARA